MAKIKGVQGNQSGKIKGPVVSQVSPEQLAPTFCLRQMRKGYDISECDNEEKAALADTLFKLSKLTWSQIRLANKHGSGSEKIAKDSIKGDSTDFLDKDTELLALRFHSMKPMVGHRGKDGIVFHIIWLDRSFTLYKH